MSRYEPFRDSTEHSNDRETLRARLAEDGYLFLRGLLPRATILDVRARPLNKTTEGGWLAPDSPFAVGVANPTAARKDPSRAIICPCFAASGRTRRCIDYVSISG